MNPLMDSDFIPEMDEATAELLERLRRNPEAFQLLNDILEVWMERGAKEDLDYYISHLLLEAETQVVPGNPQFYMNTGQDLIH